MVHNYWEIFLGLLAEPFRHVETVWGIVPLYFALLLNEMTSSKASYRSAVQTGFSFLWAAAQWIYPYFRPHDPGVQKIDFGAMLPVNLSVTLLVLVLGVVALFSGLRRSYPKYGSFLGYTRFSNYFMITIFPIQTHYLSWTWERLAAIALFAPPVWIVLNFGLMPIRNRR
jgi:hypothetical protein